MASGSEHAVPEETVTVEAPPEERRETQRQDREKPQKQPLYNVVIWNDEEHSYDYVIELLMTIFGHSYEQAFQITDNVHHRGRGIALTTHKELAELKREQILSAGADPRMPRVSKGPIRATIEPVE